MERLNIIKEKIDLWRMISGLMTNNHENLSLSEKVLCNLVWLPASIIWLVLGYLILLMSSCLMALLLQALGIAKEDALYEELCDIFEFVIKTDQKIDLFFYGIIKKDIPEERRKLIDSMIKTFDMI